MAVVGRQRLGAIGDDLQGRRRFALGRHGPDGRRTSNLQEARLLAHGIDERQATCRQGQAERQAGIASAASEIEQRDPLADPGGADEGERGQGVDDVLDARWPSDRGWRSG